ncbi:hypothetical protein UO65_1715 [Actinokineospora spheciospongiae]|uniref:Uncharacterized protein n=1 Tax=Actinokineospora spheciospongiae TaxID=909613 RepID=W7IQ40_9PSEU|nr:hypothetical protein UO65_1715 [Actinokineospora spheciospongiae]
MHVVDLLKRNAAGSADFRAGLPGGGSALAQHHSRSGAVTR